MISLGTSRPLVSLFGAPDVMEQLAPALQYAGELAVERAGVQFTGYAKARRVVRIASKEPSAIRGHRGGHVRVRELQDAAGPGDQGFMSRSQRTSGFFS